MTDLFGDQQPGAATSTACSACAAWERNPNAGAYAARCLDCKARSLAVSPEAWQALSHRGDESLRLAVGRVFGDADLEKGLAMVRAWVRKIRKAKQA